MSFRDRLNSRALTIHKAQGQTLDKVKVDIGGCFAAGMSPDNETALMTRSSLYGRLPCNP
jgi:ATP-dependent exoDNAse (exonuclease V) alpha subunit